MKKTYKINMSEGRNRQISETNLANYCRGHKEIILWPQTTFNNVFPEFFLREFKEYINWNELNRQQTLSEDLMRDFKEKLNFIHISSNQTLSEDFIREFKNELNWEALSFNQNLSEDFIREFKNLVNWEYISWGQRLSEDFILEFLEKGPLQKSSLESHQDISYSFAKKLNLDIPYLLATNENLSEKNKKTYEKYISFKSSFSSIEHRMEGYR